MGLDAVMTEKHVQVPGSMTVVAMLMGDVQVRLWILHEETGEVVAHDYAAPTTYVVCSRPLLRAVDVRTFEYRPVDLYAPVDALPMPGAIGLWVDGTLRLRPAFSGDDWMPVWRDGE